MSTDKATISLLLALLGGAAYANANRPNDKPCPCRLPDDLDSRDALIRADLLGAPATLTFHADGRNPWRESVDRVALAAFCPAADGLCRWIAIDLDAADHGASGLADPVHAARTIAERASAHGLVSGLLVARSRRGLGRHVFFLLPEPVELDDAVIGVAALVASAFKIAEFDVEEHGAPHAFRRINGEIARPGDPGAVELIPRSTTKPTYGWALALPAAGAHRAHGGGVIVDPFDDRPIHHKVIPRCDGQAWRRFINENRTALERLQQRRFRRQSDHVDPQRLRRVRPLTDEFLSGRTPPGRRNEAAFSAACNLLDIGLSVPEVKQLILLGARGCELPEPEALNVIRSALRAKGRSS